MVKDANLINEIQENKKKCIKYSKTSPLKGQKSAKISIFLCIQEIWWPAKETRRFSLYVEDPQIICKSCNRSMIESLDCMHEKELLEPEYEKQTSENLSTEE